MPRNRTVDLAKVRAKIELFKEQNAPLFIAVANEVACMQCGRVLKDPVSIARGIGPECAARLLEFEAEAELEAE